VASAPAAFRVRVWPDYVTERGHKGRRPLPEGAKVGYPHLYKFLSADRTDASYGRYTDRALEKRLLDEQAHVISTLWWHRIVPHHARVRGFTITPSHFLNAQLDTIWLAE